MCKAIDEHENFVDAQASAQEHIENEMGSEVIDAEVEPEQTSNEADAVEAVIVNKEKPNFLEDE